MALEKFEIVSVVVCCFLIVFGVIGNAAVLITKLRRPARRSVTNCLILALAGGDMIYCILGSSVLLTLTVLSSNWDSIDIYSDLMKSIIHEKQIRFCKVTFGIVFACEYYTLLVRGLIAVNCYYCASSGGITAKQTLILLISISVFSIIMGMICASVTSISTEYSEIQACTIVSMEMDTILYSLWTLSLLIILVGTITIHVKIVMFVRRRQRQVSNIRSDTSETINSVSSTSSTQIETLSSVVTRRETGEKVSFLDAENQKVPKTSETMKSPPVPMRASPPIPMRAHTLSDLSRPGQNTKQKRKRQLFRHQMIASCETLPTIWEETECLEDKKSLPSIFLQVQQKPGNSTNAPLPQNKLQQVPQHSGWNRMLTRQSMVLLITTAIFCMIWISSLVIHCFFLEYKYTIFQRNDTVYAVLIFLQELARLNHVVYPILYACTNRQFRRSFHSRFGMG